MLFIVGWLLLSGTERISAQEIAGGYVTDTEGKRSGTLTWSLDSEGNFVVRGVGPGAAYRPQGMEEYDRKCPWDRYREQIRRVYFECVFTGASLYHFEYGASLNSWFVNCVNLESYSDIPDGVTDMSATFMGCEKLETCGMIPDSVVTMQYTFSDCRSIRIPPYLPSGLRDDVYQKKGDEKVLTQASGLGLTFAGCSSLLVTPDLTVCPNIFSLVGTFADCTSLITIQNIPANINYLYDSFQNCIHVRGVLSCEAETLLLQGMPFRNIAQENDYLLFVKSPDAGLLNAVREQSGEGFRGYEWDGIFTVYFETNGGLEMNPREIRMEYGTTYGNGLDSEYCNHVSTEYYENLPKESVELPLPHKWGLVFGGWYYDAQLTLPVSEKDLVNPDREALERRNVTIYAKWIDMEPPFVVTDENLHEKWFNHPITVTFDIWDNRNGGIALIQLVQILETREILHESIEFENDGMEHYEYTYTFGKIRDNLYEGMFTWEIRVWDYSGNRSVAGYRFGFDYTPPVLYTDSPHDTGKECLYDDRDGIHVWCEDATSGPVLLKINPSNAQNTFLDMRRTPYRENAEFALDYRYENEPDTLGFVLQARDRAGNIASRVIITDKNLGNQIIRTIPRANYD